MIRYQDYFHQPFHSSKDKLVYFSETNMIDTG